VQTGMVWQHRLHAASGRRYGGLGLLRPYVATAAGVLTGLLCAPLQLTSTVLVLHDSKRTVALLRRLLVQI
jgi:hypothetical protein